MNPLIKQMLDESDVVPVLAHRPRADRLARLRHRRDPDGLEADSGDSVAEGTSAVARMIREADDIDGDTRSQVIPDNAEPLETTSLPGVNLRPVRKVVQEPSHPSGEKEAYITPLAALTAPDVTPDATVPLDPSQVPGTAKPETFTAADLQAGGSPERPDAKALDVLLGRVQPAPAQTPAPEVPQISTAEAQRLMGVAPLTESGSVELATGSAPMPAPSTSPADINRIMSVYRRATQ